MPQSQITQKPFQKSWPLVKRLMLRYLRPYGRRLILAILFMIATALTTAGMAAILEPIVNLVTQSDGNGRAVFPLAGLVLLLFVVRGLASYGQVVVMNDVGQGVVSDIQKTVAHHLLRADLAYFHSRPAGELIAIMINDINLMRHAISEAVTAVARNALMLVALVAVMFYQDWRLAFITFIAFPLLALFVATLTKKLRHTAGAGQAKWAELSAGVNELAQGARLIKAYGLEEQIAARLDHMIDRLRKLIHRVFRYSSMSRPMGEFLTGFAIAGVLVYAGYRVLGIDGHGGDLEAGALMSFIAAFIMAYEPMKRLGKLNGTLQAGLAAAERVQAILDIHPDIADPPQAENLYIEKSKGGEVQFDSVNFAYKPGHPVLQDLSFTARPGQRIGIIGASGAGKSTIINLIPRFYDVTSGAVRIDGCDVRKLSLKSLRQAVALVSQEITIFDDTAAANIGFGKPEATREEIEAAAKAAAAHDFILTLPQGYETRLGEQGVSLSGGQRQRIAIARAMLKDAPILLLDEATSALDAESERLVQQALEQLQKGRTSIIIAHKLSTIREADCIFVMQEGRILESGAHEDLMRHGGYYAKLSALQRVEA